MGSPSQHDSLQSGYKAYTSTVQCTWLVSEVLQHMLRGGINPVVTVLDCSKAFYICKCSLLFQRLLDKGLPGIVVRVLAYIYILEGDPPKMVQILQMAPRMATIPRMVIGHHTYDI